MIQSNEAHNKIVDVLKNRGPSLPIQIAKNVGLSSLFVSAFLSELTNQKQIKVSHLKVGGSPLYFLEGQEEQLEPYYKYLHPKEAEAFLLLKKKKVLKDEEQEPSIRVALRSIRDFAVGFKQGEEIYWRYFLVSDLEVNDILVPKKIVVKKEIKKVERPKIEKGRRLLEKDTGKRNTEKEVKPIKQEQKKIFQNPLAVKTEKPKKEKPKSDFVLKVIDFVERNGFKMIEERDYKAKEYNCLVQIKSELGLITFLTQAKDKKNVTKLDFEKLLSVAQSIPLPAFMLYSGQISKNAIDYLEKYDSILKVKKMG